MNKAVYKIEVPNIIGIRFILALAMLVLSEIQILYWQIKLKIQGSK